MSTQSVTSNDRNQFNKLIVLHIVRGGNIALSSVNYSTGDDLKIIKNAMINKIKGNMRNLYTDFEFYQLGGNDDNRKNRLDEVIEHINQAETEEELYKQWDYDDGKRYNSYISIHSYEAKNIN